MNIGIKYCGGCNPTFNRIKLVEKIIEKYKKQNFEAVKKDVLYDLLLVVNGCLSSCSDVSSLKFKEKILLNSEDDVRLLEQYIKNECVN
jgi:4-hydroxybutyrate CoA-transferase